MSGCIDVLPQCQFPVVSSYVNHPSARQPRQPQPAPHQTWTVQRPHAANCRLSQRCGCINQLMGPAVKFNVWSAQVPGPGGPWPPLPAALPPIVWLCIPRIWPNLDTSFDTSVDTSSSDMGKASFSSFPNPRSKSNLPTPNHRATALSCHPALLLACLYHHHLAELHFFFFFWITVRLCLDPTTLPTRDHPASYLRALASLSLINKAIATCCQHNTKRQTLTSRYLASHRDQQTLWRVKLACFFSRNLVHSIFFVLLS